MAYIKETVISGKVIEVKKYYSARYRRRDAEARNIKVNESSEAQKKINLKRSEDRLRQIINTNFAPGDLHVTLTYSPKIYTPDSFEEAKKAMANFIRRIKRAAMKDNAEIRYVYVNGVGARSFHHHLVISRNAMEYIEKLWTFGRPKFVSLEKGGDYSALAAYLASHFEKTDSAGEGKKWHGSKNLLKPVIKKQIIKSNGFAEIPKAKWGYYLDENSVEMGIHDFTGYPYLSYRMIELPKQVRGR